MRGRPELAVVALMPRALLLLLLLYGLHASAGVTTPARLTEGPQSIESLLRLPQSLAPGRYQVSCEAWVRRNGSVNSFNCYYKTGTPALVSAVSRAGRGARFIPATRDGKSAAVLMQVMVRIDITKQGPLVLVVPNNGVEVERYGLFYTAPQRFNEFTWNGVDRDFQPDRVLMWQKLSIDEHGKVLEFEVKNESDAPQFLVKRIEEQVKRMEFRPGYFEGKPVPMRYVEPVME